MAQVLEQMSHARYGHAPGNEAKVAQVIHSN
jgi:hypothetical protein